MRVRLCVCVCVCVRLGLGLGLVVGVAWGVFLLFRVVVCCVALCCVALCCVELCSVVGEVCPSIFIIHYEVLRY